MIHGVGFALGALVANGLFDLAYKRAAQAGVPAHSLLMVQGWGFISCVSLYGLASGTLRIAPPMLWGALGGLFVFAGFYNFARSLHAGSVSINAPIFRMSFLITAALAVAALNEAITPYKALGLALALAAVWLLLGRGASGAAARRLAGASLVRVAVATVAIGIANLIYKVGLQAGATPAGMLTAQAAVFVPLSTGFVRFAEGRIRPTRQMLRHGLVAGAMLATALMLLLEGLARGPASVLVPIAQMGFMVTAAAGFLVLKEPFTARTGLGLALALAALASLAAS